MRPHGTDHASPTLPAFEPLDSVRSRWKSNALGLFLSAFGLAWVGMTAGVLLLLLDTSEPLALRICLVAIAALPYTVIPYARRRSRHPDRMAFDAMRVDETGVHWLRSGQPVRVLRWQELANCENGFADIDAVRNGGFANGAYVSHHVLVVRRRAGKEVRDLDLYFRGGRVFHNIYTNEGELRARFLLGVRTFRPDLKIGIAVFLCFPIDQETLTYKAREDRQSLTAGWIGSILITAFIFFAISKMTG